MTRILKTGDDLSAAIESVARRIARATGYAIEDGEKYDTKNAMILAKQIFEHLTEYVEEENTIATEPGYGARG